MNIPVREMIQEISTIPRAIWASDNSTKPTHSGTHQPLEEYEGTFKPVFDDESFVPSVSPQWEEKLNKVRRDLTVGSKAPLDGPASGTEALAWYSSFHSRRDDWGIYIPLSSLPIIDHLYLSNLSMPRQHRWRLAWDILIAHEVVHFAVDYAVGWFELMYHAPIRRVFADRKNIILERKVLAIRPGYLEVEEALANGNVLRALTKRISSDASEAVRLFIKTQPPGYCDGHLAESNDGFAAIARETLRSYLTVWTSGWNIDLGNPALDLTRLLPLSKEARTACPVRVINDLENVGLAKDAVQLITRIHPIEETKAFKKKLLALDPKFQRSWESLKTRLASGFPGKSDFKKWKDEKWEGRPLWSIRVNGSIRAHLGQPEPHSGLTWFAVRIGGHKEMGHG